MPSRHEPPSEPMTNGLINWCVYAYLNFNVLIQMLLLFTTSKHPIVFELLFWVHYATAGIDQILILQGICILWLQTWGTFYNISQWQYPHYPLLADIQFNWLAPGIVELNFRRVIFKLISVIDGRSIFGEIALRWILLDPTDDKSTLFQVMAWFFQARSHYLSKFWPITQALYGYTRS